MQLQAHPQKKGMVMCLKGIKQQSMYRVTYLEVSK